jgi:hypothetical protein
MSVDRYSSTPPLAEQGRIEGLVSAVSFTNVFYRGPTVGCDELRLADSLPVVCPFGGRRTSFPVFPRGINLSV